MRSFWNDTNLISALKVRQIFLPPLQGGIGYRTYQKLRIWLCSPGSFAAEYRPQVQHIAERWGNLHILLRTVSSATHYIDAITARISPYV